jgi:hypothetical protein
MVDLVLLKCIVQTCSGQGDGLGQAILGIEMGGHCGDVKMKLFDQCFNVFNIHIVIRGRDCDSVRMGSGL